MNLSHLNWKHKLVCKSAKVLDKMEEYSPFDMWRQPVMNVLTYILKHAPVLSKS